MSNEILKYDILKELFNISVGKAASLLSEIIDKKILLDVPRVEVLDIENKDKRLTDYLPKDIDGALMVSSISFEEKLNGRANLIFPADKMRTFINLCSEEQESDKYYETNFTDVDFDIIKEVGNIILNSIIGEVGNNLNLNLNYSLPEVKVYSKIDFSKDIENNEFNNILLLHINFVIDSIEIEGAIVVDLTMNSMKELMDNLDRIEENLYE